MKLATLKSPNPKNRDGRLVVVSSDNRIAVECPAPDCQTMLSALENWRDAEKCLRSLSEKLNASGSDVPGAFALKWEDCLAPLPRAPGFYDGSAFLSHVVRARRARGDEMPASARVTPLMYQGVSDNLLAWNSPLDIQDTAFGGDFEGEFAVVTTDVPKAATSAEVESRIALLCMFNDITLREIVKTEIETKFGFLQSKPNSSFAPLLVTPDELGSDWSKGRVMLDLSVEWNGKRFGNPNGSEMHFSFPDLVAHACRTRPLAAGTIVGSGTISNEDKARGFACLTELRFQEILDGGKATTAWLQPGDTVKMDVQRGGVSIFGRIEQTATVVAKKP